MGVVLAVDLVGQFAERVELLFALTAGRLRDFPVVLRMDDQHATLQIGICRFQISGNVVAVLRVVGHDKEDRPLAELLVLFVGLAPLNHAQVQVVGVFLRILRASPLAELGAARLVGQDRMLDDILRNGLHQRIVANRLHEDRAVVVPRRSGRVHLQRQRGILLQQPVMDVLDRLEPRHSRFVDMVGFVVRARPTPRCRGRSFPGPPCFRSSSPTGRGPRK